ncbi:MAG: MarR family winged helix-turn-helix transcriptional regulator [Pseudomonadota bacterium]
MTDTLDLESFFPFLLSRLSNRVSNAIAATYSDEHALSVRQWRVLCLVGNYPGTTARAVAEKGALDKVAVSRSVAHLVDRGLVEREVDEQDRRQVHLKLSRTGLAITRAIVPRALAVEAQMLAALSEEERRVLTDCMDRLFDRTGDLREAE